jgi:hypothetical protein
MTLANDTRGAVYVEFLLAFIPVFILFLGMLQAALLYAANLVVSHAATTAVRSAVVVLPDDPRHYGDEPVNAIDFTGTGGATGDAVSIFLEGVGIGGGAPPAAGSTGGKRLGAIRSAAAIPLLAVSPSFEQLVGDPTVYTAVGGNPGSRAATGAALYNRAGLAVTFPDRPGARSFRTRFGSDDDVTVRVTYLFHCGVPLASWYMCDDYLSLRTGVPRAALQDLARRSASGTATPDEMAALVRRVRLSRERLGRARPGMDELAQAEAPWLGYLTALTGSRFVVLRAEATMRNQGADYPYRGDI